MTIDKIREEQKKNGFEPCFNTVKVCNETQCEYRKQCIFLKEDFMYWGKHKDDIRDATNGRR